MSSQPPNASSRRNRKGALMKHQIPLDSAARADSTLQNPPGSRGARQVLPDVACKRLAIVNVVFYGRSGAADRQWVLIDAGLTGTGGMIARAAEQRFGRGSRPAA